MNTDAAYVELAEAKKAVRASRRAFAKSPDSAFVRTMRGVITQYLQARAAGVSREDGIKGIEEELRGAWPKSVSKFKPTCDNCEDTGWVERTCWDRHRCSRQVCARNPERTHAFVEQCHCEKGSARVKRTYTPEDAIAAAGRTARKKTGWRQVGA